MHVEDSVGFSQPKGVKIEVVNQRGESTTMDISPDLSIEKLKTMALAVFNRDPIASVKLGPQYKLVSVLKKRQLIEEATARDECLADGDAILLLQKFPTARNEEYSKESSCDPFANDMQAQSPTDREIEEATSGIQPKNMERKAAEAGVPLDFQRELRKILISLVDYSERLLRNHPEVSPVFSEINTCSNDFDESEDVKDRIDKDALRKLTDMGFPSERAKRALKLNNQSPIESMDWLLAYESTSAAASFSGSVPSSSSEAAKIVDTNVDIFKRIPLIVNCYRNFKRKHFKPNAKAFNNLKQIGFDDHEVLDSLWIHSNNEVSACEWLLSDRRPKRNDLERGLKANSPIYKSVIQNPTIQLGLMKPKIFFAFLQLIEEPNGTGRWLTDVEMSPVLSQIFRIYHSEKHAGDEMDSSVNSSSTSESIGTPQCTHDNESTSTDV